MRRREFLGVVVVAVVELVAAQSMSELPEEDRADE
jgi:hypothetical protein